MDILICNTCNKCCKRSGRVPLTDADYALIPDSVKFYALPTQNAEREFSHLTLSAPISYVLDTPLGGACVFSVRNGCHLGINMPEVCRDFPTPAYYANPRMKLWLKRNCLLYEDKEG